MICSTYSLRRPWKTVFFADHDLGDAGGVAQVNEGDTTVVAAPGHPAGEGYGLSNVLGAKGSEVMCAQHYGPFGNAPRRRKAAAVRCGLINPERVYRHRRPMVAPGAAARPRPGVPSPELPAAPPKAHEVPAWPQRPPAPRRCGAPWASSTPPRWASVPWSGPGCSWSSPPWPHAPAACCGPRRWPRQASPSPTPCRVAALAAAHPASGGAYLYGRLRLGEWPGFVAGWGFLTGKTASCAAMAYTFATSAPAVPPSRLAVGAVAAVTGREPAGHHPHRRRCTAAGPHRSLGLLAFVGRRRSRPPGPRRAARRAADGAGPCCRPPACSFFAFAGYARVATLGEEVGTPNARSRRRSPWRLAFTLVLYGLTGRRAGPSRCRRRRRWPRPPAPGAGGGGAAGAPAWRPRPRRPWPASGP